MLRLFAALPVSFVAAPPRALADGSSGSLGAATVGTHELRGGSVTLDRMADLGGGQVVGRPQGAGPGTPEPLDAVQLARLVSLAQPAEIFPARADAEAADIPAGVQALRVEGRDAAGDGGASTWARRGLEPDHPGKFQSLDGAWWELADPVIRPEVLGALGDGTTNDTQAWRDALEIGRPVLGRAEATYRIADTLPVLRDDAVIEGAGARVIFTGASKDLFAVGDGALRVERARIGGFSRIEMPDAFGAAVAALRTTGLHVERIAVATGAVLRAGLRPDFPTRAAGGAVIPDVTEAGIGAGAAGEAVMAAELNRDLTLIEFEAIGTPGLSDQAGAAPAVQIGWTEDWIVARGRIRGAFHGVRWHGGDGAPGRDGGEGSRRWCRRGTVREVEASGLSGDGFGGDQAEALTLERCRARDCAGIGVMSRGGLDLRVADCEADGCAEGVKALHVAERTLFEGCRVRGPGGAALFVREGEAAAGSSVTWRGGTLTATSAAGGYGTARIAAGGEMRLEQASLENAVIVAEAGPGRRRLEGLRLRFAADPGAAFAAVTATAPTDADGDPAFDGLRVERVETRVDFTPDAQARFFDATTGAGAPFELRGCSEAGFAVFVAARSQDGTAAHALRLIDNAHDGAVRLDGTEGRTILQVLTQGGRRASGAAPFEAEAPPRTGVWAAGSWTHVADPTRPSLTGWRCTVSGGAAGGVWSEGSVYAAGEQAEGSDGRVYRATSASGPGAGGALDPVAGPGWTAVAETRGRFALMGASTVGDTAVSLTDRGADPNGADPAAARLAWDKAWAEVWPTGGTIHVPEGTYLVDQAFAPFRRPDGAGAKGVTVRGDGQATTTFQQIADFTSPMFDVFREADATGPASESHSFEHFGIHGGDFRGGAFRFHMAIRMKLRDLKVLNVDDVAIDGLEWWDSNIFNCLLEFCGREGTADQNDGLPALRLQNRVPEVPNSSCNNLMFYHLHVENHKSWAMQLLDTTRQCRFHDLKCHHNPTAFPPPGHGHILMDRRNAPAGAPLNIGFIAPRLAVSSGEGFLLRNTGGAPQGGPREITVVGGSIHSQAYDGVRIDAGNGVNFGGGLGMRTNALGNGGANFRVNAAARGVSLDWNALFLFDGEPILFEGDDYAVSPAKALEIASGRVNYLGLGAAVDTEGLVGADILHTIENGTHGALFSVRAASPSRQVILSSSIGNIRLKGGTDQDLEFAGGEVLLRYDAADGLWREV